MVKTGSPQSEETSQSTKQPPETPFDQLWKETVGSLENMMSLMGQPTSSQQEEEQAYARDIKDLMGQKDRNRGNKSDDDIEEEDSTYAVHGNGGNPGDDDPDDDNGGGSRDGGGGNGSNQNQAFPPFSITKPIMGGIIRAGLTQIAWTGGKPRADWKALELGRFASPNSPLCFRPTDPITQAKAYTKMSTPPAAITKLEKSLDPRSLIQTLQLFLEHVEETGIDPIFYVEHPNDNTETVSVIKEYANLSTEHVTKELQWLKPKGDSYDRANDKIARKLIYSILGTALFRDAKARDPKGDIAVIWMYAMDQRASLNSDQIEAIKGKMKALTPIKIPGQIKVRHPGT
jgi:hypothetical protein